MKKGFSLRTIPLESQQVCVHVCVCPLQRGIMSSALKGGGGVEGLMKGPLCPTCRLSAVVSLLKRQLLLRRSV